MKANSWQEDRIKNILLEEAKKIEPSEELFNKIEKGIKERESEYTMRNKLSGLNKGRRVAALVASFILLTSLTVWGVTKGNTWVGYSDLTYKDIPTKKEIKRDVGFIPKYSETLPGGFEFVDGYTGVSVLSGDTGDVLTKTKDITMRYKCEGEKSTFNLIIEKIDEKFLDRSESELVGDFEGIDFYYYEKDYKFVPENYELSPEDKMLYESGKLEISYGASEVTNTNIQALSWYDNGLEYRIMSGDYGFEIDELIDIAKFIIQQ